MRLETAIRATPSNPTAEGCPVGLTGFGRRCWVRTTESCLSRALCSVSPGPPPRVALIFTAGLAGLVAGAVSMALGEWVFGVESAGSDKSPLARERRELREMPPS